MILNYLFYDKLVFGSSTPAKDYIYTPELADTKVSIIVPVYNAEEYIDECIQSILNQTYEDYELVKKVYKKVSIKK